VYISEVVVDPDVWVNRPSGLTPGADQWDDALLNAEAVQENSHTPQKAFGYILESLRRNHKPPRLAVGTHFQAEDDTIALALKDIRSWYAGPVVLASDLMVIRVTNGAVEPYRAVVSDYSWSAHWDRGMRATKPPKYGAVGECSPYQPYGPMRQFSPDTLNMIIDPAEYDPTGWQVQRRDWAEQCMAESTRRR
jgi:ribonuclease Z